MDGPVLQWLLAGDPVLRAVVHRDLLDDPSKMDGVAADPRIQAMFRKVSDWPWPILTSHKSAGHPIHQLAFLAELGVDLERSVGNGLLRSVTDTMVDGLPRLLTNVPERYGGSGKNEWAWALCDAPLVLYSLWRCFPSFDGEAGMRTLILLSRENGMPCRVSPELGKWRGPGRKDDPCPLASLYTLRTARWSKDKASEDLARTISDSLLSLWEGSRERHPYMFFMGTDFRKLKLPFVWYDILNVADTLSLCPWVHDDGRFQEMLSVIDLKRDAEGRYTPGSVWTSWKGWDFCQKKEASRWVTFVVERLHRRVE
jgi:hypothetical protein